MKDSTKASEQVCNLREAAIALWCPRAISPFEASFRTCRKPCSALANKYVHMTSTQDRLS